MTLPDITLDLLGAEDPVGDPARFADWLRDQMGSGRTIAVDTETTGLDWWTPGFLRLVQFGTADSGWAVPASWYPKVIDWALRTLVDAGTHVVFHNANFDLHALRGYPEIRNVGDTKLLHHLCKGGAGSHGLKAACKAAFGPWAGSGQTELRKAMNQNGWDWATVPVDLPAYWAYGVLDTCLTARLHDHLTPSLDGSHRAAYERELAYQAVMFRAEARGVRIDVDYASALADEWRARASVLRQQLVDGGVPNPNSNRMFEAALTSLGWAPDEWTSTGQARLDKPVLEAIRTLGGPAGDLAAQLVEYKQLVKWGSTYLVPFIESGGTVHPSINTMAARHGRSSIQRPAMQTLPSHDHRIRRAVIPGPGERLVSIDYEGQELRLLASYAREQAMISEFVTGSGDLHSLAARLVYGDGFSKEHRTIAKIVNFALIYGAGPSKLALQAGVSEAEMTSYLNTYNARFPDVRRFLSSVQQVVRSRATEDSGGWVKTWGGRVVAVDEDKPYTGVNYLISGSGADVLKEAVLRLDKAGLADHIVIPVHDELVFSFPEGEAEEMTRAAVECMEDRSFLVPLTVSASAPVANWAEAK